MLEKCSEKLCARMPHKRRSQFSEHFLSPDFGAFHAELEFLNTHRRLHNFPSQELFSMCRAIFDLKPGRGMALQYSAVPTAQLRAAFFVLHFAVPDVLVPTGACVLDLCRA